MSNKYVIKIGAKAANLKSLEVSSLFASVNAKAANLKGLGELNLIFHYRFLYFSTRC